MIRLVMVLVVGIFIGIQFMQGNMAQMEIELREKYDKDYAGNYIWSDLVKHYQEPPNADGKKLSWFEGEYRKLEYSWQDMVLTFNNKEDLPTDMEADIVRFEYLPWVRDLLRETRNRQELPYQSEKLFLLELRQESLEALEKYFRTDVTQFLGEYKKKDAQFRDMIQEHPEYVEE